MRAVEVGRKNGERLDECQRAGPSYYVSGVLANSFFADGERDQRPDRRQRCNSERNEYRGAELDLAQVCSCWLSIMEGKGRGSARSTTFAGELQPAPWTAG